MTLLLQLFGRPTDISPVVNILTVPWVQIMFFD